MFVTNGKNKKKPVNPGYPAATAGSKAAEALRSQANSLSYSERENLFKMGMQVIYGGNIKKAVSNRH